MGGKERFERRGNERGGGAGRRLGCLVRCLPSIGGAEAAAGAGGLGDTVGKGAGEVVARLAPLAAGAAGQFFPAGGEGTGIVDAAGAVGAEALEAAAE